MRRRGSAIVVGAVMAGVAGSGCGEICGEGGCFFNDQEWAVIQTLTPLPEMPADPSNKYWDHEGAAILGQKLFHEASYAGPLRVAHPASEGGLGALGERYKVSCASCHIPSSQFMDTRSRPNNVSLGTAWTARNTPTLVNIGFRRRFISWTARQDSLWNQASTSPESPDNTGGDRCEYLRMVFDRYREEYDAIFDEKLPGELAVTSTSAEMPQLRFPITCKPKSNAMAPDGNWERMPPDDQRLVLRIMSNYAKAISAFEMKLVSRNSPFDRYVAGERDAMSAEAVRGLRLFVSKAACVDCHNGPLFSDEQAWNIGVPQEGPNVPVEDLGFYNDLPRVLAHPLNQLSEFVDGAPRMEIAGLMRQEGDKGKFRTPTLRQVARTAPYFHTGGVRTLREVVEFYNRGGAASGFSGVKDPRLKPLLLTDTEIDDLVAFMESLTGEPLPEELTRNPL